MQAESLRGHLNKQLADMLVGSCEEGAQSANILAGSGLRDTKASQKIKSPDRIGVGRQKEKGKGEEGNGRGK